MQKALYLLEVITEISNRGFSHVIHRSITSVEFASSPGRRCPRIVRTAEPASRTHLCRHGLRLSYLLRSSSFDGTAISKNRDSRASADGPICEKPILLRQSATALAEERAFPVGISIEGGQRYISRTRHEPVAFPRTIPLPGRLLAPVKVWPRMDRQNGPVSRRR